jgi:hypothetical protein
MPEETPTPTAHARVLLNRGDCVRDIALATGLHPAYIRKIRQRDAGQDDAWQRWRDDNPETVRKYWRERMRRRAQRIASQTQPPSARVHADGTMTC